MKTIQHRRGPRAALDAAGVNGGLRAGELYLIEDEGRAAMGLSETEYEPLAKLNEISGDAPPSLLSRAGRFTLAGNQWVTNSDDNYGPNAYSNFESAGSGAVPVLEFEHLGHVIPAGRTIKGLNFGGRMTVEDGDDLELYAVLRFPAAGHSFSSGIDMDGEMDATVLYNDLFMTPAVGAAFSGEKRDTHIREIALDHTVDQLSFLSLYIRAVGSLSAARYFTGSWSWLIA